MKELSDMSAIELLRVSEEVIDELKRRGIVRTRDKPIGGYTEWLVCERMELERAPNNQRAYDARDKNGKLYQIKGGQKERGTVTFSPMRNLDQQDFHYVVAVAFNDDYSIRFAVQIPHDRVREFARRTVNGHQLSLNDDIVNRPGVTNIRDRLS